MAGKRRSSKRGRKVLNEDDGVLKNTVLMIPEDINIIAKKLGLNMSAIARKAIKDEILRLVNILKVFEKFGSLSNIEELNELIQWTDTIKVNNSNHDDEETTNKDKKSLVTVK